MNTKIMDIKKELAIRYQISIPNIYQNILPREEVENILDHAAIDEVVCFVAPYGYGKTFAVISWLQKYNCQTAWLDMHRVNNSENDLLAYLTAAVLSLTGKQEDNYEFINSSDYINNPRAFLMKAIAQALQDHHEKILVIDNFHLITSMKILGFMKEVIYTLLRTWRIILISRAELHPVFNDLILKKHVCFITIKELSLSKKEIMDYFLINGHHIAEENIQQIQEETEGWPAALNAALTVSNENLISNREIFHTYIISFFETEIWRNLSENIKDFLVKTSILDILTPASCRIVTNESATLPILKWLYANGLFISKLDKKDTYCYYHVFWNFLKEKRNTSGIDVRELYKKFGWWLYEQDKYTQSFPYFFKAGDLYSISQVLRILNPADMGIENFLKTVGCIIQLNTADLKPYPNIIINMALIYYLTGDVTKMQSLYHTLLNWNDAGVLSVTLEDYAAYQWEIGWLYYLDPDEPTQANEKHLEWNHNYYYAIDLKEINHNVGRYSVFMLPSIFRGIRDYGNDGIFYTESILEGYERGERNILNQEEDVWNTYLIFAEYMYEIENYAKAEQTVRRIMTLVEDRKYTYLYFVCTAILVKLIRAVHNPKEIETLTARLERLIIKNEDYFLLPNFHAFEQRNQLADGKIGFTEKFKEENKDNEDKPYYYLLYRHITFVRVFLSTGEYNRAILILEHLTILCEKYKRPTDLIEVNILKATALYERGFEEDSMQSILAALNAARKYGYIRIFSDDAKSLLPILNILPKEALDNYIKKIIISCKKTLAHAGIHTFHNSYSHINITKTEIEILKCLQADMSYSEIALDNDIQVSTVKSHIHSIYSKLEVRNKTSAVIAARKMGILDP